MGINKCVFTTSIADTIQCSRTGFDENGFPINTCSEFPCKKYKNMVNKVAKNNKIHYHNWERMKRIIDLYTDNFNPSVDTIYDTISNIIDYVIYWGELMDTLSCQELKTSYEEYLSNKH